MEKILKKTILFKDLEKKDIEKIKVISEIKTHASDEMIFFEGEDADGLYIVKSGKIKIFKLSPDGKEQILHIFGEGEPFGEVAVFSKTSFPANAQALEKSESIYIKRSKLMDIFKQDPSIAMNIIAMLCLRLKYFTNMIEDLTLKELPARVAAYILQEEKSQGEKSEITLEYSKGQLAKILGSSQESLSRVLTKLSKAGVIDTDKKVIRIVKRDILTDLSEGIENIKNLIDTCK